jgi:D-3-phosphoglycerate dehydrogenase
LKVLITDMRHSSSIEEEKVLTPEGIEVDTTFCASEEDLISNGKTAFAFLVSYAKITQRVLEALVNLKVIIKYGIGVDNIDVSAATELGKMVVNVPDYCTEEVALHALTLILNGVRMIPQFNKIVKEGGWEIDPEPIVCYRLSQQNLGLVGFGRIARKLACFMKPMVKSVLFYDPYISEQQYEASGYHRVSSSEDLFSSCSIVSLHLPLTPQTKEFINMKHFEKAENLILVNTSRGGIIHKKDLLSALNSKHILFWGSDVFFHEPPDRNDKVELEILNHPKSLITPHVAWCSSQSAKDVRRMAAEEALRVAKGQLPQNIVNIEVLSKL